jgi:transcriptional regulator with XRE-family HTH domain
VVQTLESTPRAQTHWSTRSLAQASGLSRMTISRIWRAFCLQPHRTDTFKLSPDPLLIEKVRDTAALEWKASRVIGQLHRRHRSSEFRPFLEGIEANVPAGMEVHIIVDH